MPEDGAARPERAKLTMKQRACKAPRNTAGYESTACGKPTTIANYKTIANNYRNPYCATSFG